MEKSQIKKQAFTFILLLGFISLLSDFTHEGARSIYGPFLGLIGASAFVISLTSGLGEFIGQALRILTGWIADKTKKYWTMMILGYAMNLLVIPLLMFVDANIWQVAIILILFERVGKGIRAPAKSALVSFTTPHLGVGKAFALQEALDQFGAFLGPLFVYAILTIQQGGELAGYQLVFGLLGIFALLTLVILVIAKTKYPNPDHFENNASKPKLSANKQLLLYLVAVMFIALGFIDYPVLAFHMGTLGTIDIVYVPLLYALAMGVDALAALAFGHLYDKKGIISLAVSVAISIAISPIFFLIDGVIATIIAIILWGISMGAQESILKAVIASLVEKDKRATAYGIFYSVFGASWFVGSLIVGALYEYNLVALVLFTASMELVALVLLIIYARQKATSKRENIVQS